MTRRKEEESQSSSIYHQNDIWTPTVAFADFIDNETLLGEVGGSGDGGEGLLWVWRLGCPHTGRRLEGMNGLLPVLRFRSRGVPWWPTRISPGTPTTLRPRTWIPAWTWGREAVEAGLRLEVRDWGRGWFSGSRLRSPFSSSLFLQDLVAWVTASFLHIPHAEDIPNTVTVGNKVGFLLRPYNFFDEDPSILLPGSVYFEKGQDAGLCGVNPAACVPHLAACVPDLPPFSYQDF